MCWQSLACINARRARATAFPGREVVPTRAFSQVPGDLHSIEIQFSPKIISIAILHWIVLTSADCSRLMQRRTGPSYQVYQPRKTLLQFPMLHRCAFLAFFQENHP